jgi:hypothetical protein
MDEKLKQILQQLERHGTLNREDIPTLIEKVRDLYWSAELAWQQLEQDSDDCPVCIGAGNDPKTCSNTDCHIPDFPIDDEPCPEMCLCTQCYPEQFD